MAARPNSRRPIELRWNTREHRPSRRGRAAWTGRAWWRRSLKALHQIAGIAGGGGLAACLVIGMTANAASAGRVRRLAPGDRGDRALRARAVACRRAGHRHARHCRDARLPRRRLGLGQGAARPERVRGDAGHRRRGHAAGRACGGRRRSGPARVAAALRAQHAVAAARAHRRQRRARRLATRD